MAEAISMFLKVLLKCIDMVGATQRNNHLLKSAEINNHRYLILARVPFLYDFFSGLVSINYQLGYLKCRVIASMNLLP